LSLKNTRFCPLPYLEENVCDLNGFDRHRRDVTRDENRYFCNDIRHVIGNIDSHIFCTVLRFYGKRVDPLGNIHKLTKRHILW